MAKKRKVLETKPKYTKYIQTQQLPKRNQLCNLYRLKTFDCLNVNNSGYIFNLFKYYSSCD